MALRLVSTAPHCCGGGTCRNPAHTHWVNTGPRDGSRGPHAAPAAETRARGRPVRAVTLCPSGRRGRLHVLARSRLFPRSRGPAVNERALLPQTGLSPVRGGGRQQHIQPERSPRERHRQPPRAPARRDRGWPRRDIFAACGHVLLKTLLLFFLQGVWALCCLPPTETQTLSRKKGPYPVERSSPRPVSGAATQACLSRSRFELGRPSRFPGVDLWRPARRRCVLLTATSWRLVHHSVGRAPADLNFSAAGRSGGPGRLGKEPRSLPRPQGRRSL